MISEIDWKMLATLCKIPKFHPISWCRNFAERHNFHRVSGETLRKLRFSTKFTLREIRWNFAILHGVNIWDQFSEKPMTRNVFLKFSLFCCVKQDEKRKPWSIAWVTGRIWWKWTVEYLLLAFLHHGWRSSNAISVIVFLKWYLKLLWVLMQYVVKEYIRIFSSSL